MIVTANYSNPQFTPGFNRLRGGSGAMGTPVPKRVEQHPVDPQAPYFPIHVGEHSGIVRDNSGRERAYYFYIPTTIQPCGNTAFVFASAGETAKACFEKGNWKAALEKYEMAGFFVAPDGDWNREDPGEELDCFLRVYDEARDLQFFAGGGDAFYAIGLGTGAYMATVFSLLYSSSFAAFAAAGECNIEDQLLDLVGGLPTDGDARINKRDYPMPAWILDSNGSGKNVAEYLKTACRARDEHLRNDVAQIWRETPKPGEAYINSQPCTEVWYSDKSEYAALAQSSADALIDRMLHFVVSFKHWGGADNGHFRRTKSTEDMGLVKMELTVDGLKRHWYVYEPTVCKNNPNKAYPLVVAIHGFSCSGAFFAENSGWESIAEERGLLVAFPSGYPFALKNAPHKRSIAPLPAWNSFGNGDPEGPDDVKFIRLLIETMASKYPVDLSRVYATGHSNGSAMTQLLMRRIPELFAAFGPIGAMEASFGAEAVPEPNDTPRPVWYMMGEYDLGDADRLEEGTANYKTVANLCRCNRADINAGNRYVNGIYKNFVAYNAEHMPIVRFTGVSRWPHTVTPETSLMLWDEFMCKFVRNTDGSVTYLG